MRIAGGRVPRIALGTAGGIVAALGLAQLVLPGIAAQRVRDRVGRYGDVRSASVTAFPAIELLWGGAQSSTVAAGSLRMSLSEALELLWDARGVDRVDITAESIQLGPLEMRRASIHKRGDAVSVEGSVEPSDLRAALPGGVEVQIVGSADGEVQVRVGGSLFGVSASVRALVGAKEGKLVVQPQGFLLFPGLGTITLFSDPRLLLRGLELSPAAAAQGGYRLRLWATLR